MHVFVAGLLVALSFGCKEGKKHAHDSVPGVEECLRAYELGDLSLSDVTELGGRELQQAITLFYETNSSAVSDKCKLVVSRCYAFQGKYTQAVEAATNYISTYPSDYRGWRIIGSASAMLNSFDQALWGYTNAVMRGDERSYVSLAGVALHTGHTNIIRDIVPHLLILKGLQRTPPDERIEIPAVLATYAACTGQEDVFVKAVEGLTPQQLSSREDLSRAILFAYDKFHSPETSDLCERLRESLSSASNATSAVSGRKQRAP